MTISATSQGLKPGVCTSSNRPANPFTGMMIFETDTNRLAVYNGSAWVVLADADTPPGLELVKTQTIGSAVSSVTVSDAFSSTYDNYLIMVDGGAATTTVDISLQLGSTTSGYYGFLVYGAYTANTVNGEAHSNTANFKYLGSGSTSGLTAYGVLKSPFLTEESSLLAQSARPNTSNWAYWYNGFLNNTTSYTAFTIAVNTGTMTGGTIRVYGYRNS